MIDTIRLALRSGKALELRRLSMRDVMNLESLEGMDRIEHVVTSCVYRDGQPYEGDALQWLDIQDCVEIVEALVQAAIGSAPDDPLPGSSTPTPSAGG